MEGGAVSPQSESGESRELKPADDGKYYISTAEQLKEFRDEVNSGKTDAWAELTDDIDLSGICGEESDSSWTPIGNSEENAYTGTFDGNGKTISGLYINSSSADYQGLFGYLSTDGENTGTVKDLTVSGTVSGGMYVGGVVGQNGGRITDCAFSGNVTSSGGRVGGVVGWNDSGTVKNCYNTGAVNSSGNSVGGVVGWNDRGTVTNCYNTGEVSGNSYVGGVVGWNGGTVENCYNTGSVSGPYSGHSNQVGGVVGRNDEGHVTNCYNTGEVSGSDSGTSNYVGGVVGLNSSSSGGSGTVTGCYFLQENGVPANGIGGGYTDRQTAEPVNDLSELCNAFNDTNTWTIHPVLGRPVLNENWEGGDGSPESPYEISTATQLKNFATAVNGKDGNPDAHAKLMNNIDLSSVRGESNSWTPIGSDSRPYTGTFDGAGHTISGLYIGSAADDQGLFGYVGTGGTVQNLSVSGSVSGNNYVGGVVGQNRGTFENCDFTGTVTGGWYVGGIVGYNGTGATVSNCYNTGQVNDSGNSVGGVVGYNDSSASVANCYYQTGKGATVGVGGTTGDNSSQTEIKSLEDFHSGEVAWRLQNGQTAGEGGVVPLVWGQSKLGETTSLPTLNPTDEQKVYQVTFDYGDSFTETDDRYDYHYANANDNVTLPTNTDQIPEYEGHTLTGWQNEDGQAVTEPITVTADTTFTAQWTKDTVNYTVTVSADPEAGGTVSGSGEYSEGTQVTVTATPATGYHFVNWTENGTEVSTEATFTFNATVDRNLIAIFAKNEEPEPTPDPTPTPDPEPSGPSTDDSTGWDDILDELENTENGDEITIDMGDETKVPAEIFESLAGKDVDVTFDLGDVQWSVNGADIPTDTDFTDLDLGASLGTSGIPVNVINTITGEVGTVQITLAHDGEFGFTMTLTAPLGKENAGYWANLYHYDEDAEALNFEAAAKIDEDGSVTIPFSHASQYAIVIDTHSHATVDIARDAWYKDAIQYAYDNGLMTGVSDTEFAPEATTTRAMIVSILARLEGVTTAEAAGFADVNDEWYVTAVNWAASVGVVNGYEDNTFRPNTPITREQLAAILMNYAAYKGEDVSNRADLANYTDQPSTWAQEAMQWAVAEGLITGVTADTLQPQGAATRAQVAAILQRFLSE